MTFDLPIDGFTGGDREIDAGETPLFGMDFSNNWAENGFGGVMMVNDGFSDSPPGQQAWLGDVPPVVVVVEQLGYSVEGEYLPLPGDIDIDGDVDIADYGLFADCMAGPDVTDPPIGCDPRRVHPLRPSRRWRRRPARLRGVPAGFRAVVALIRTAKPTPNGPEPFRPTRGGHLRLD